MIQSNKHQYVDLLARLNYVVAHSSIILYTTTILSYDNPVIWADKSYLLTSAHYSFDVGKKKSYLPFLDEKNGSSENVSDIYRLTASEQSQN